MLVHLSAGEAVELRPGSEPAGDALEKVAGVHAVVVGKGDHVRVDEGESDVASARETTCGTQPNELERRARLEHGNEAVVVVLVDHENPEVPVRLLLERVEQAPELIDASDRRDDQVEARRAGVAHLREAIVLVVPASIS